MENQETKKMILSIEEVEKLKYNSTNFIDLKKTFIDQNQEINSIYTQAQFLISENKKLQNLLDKSKERNELFEQIMIMLNTKIKSLKIEKKYLKQRFKLNQKSTD
jgi:hypothetical protein